MPCQVSDGCGLRPQCGTRSASMVAQRELQVAAHTLYQQVVRVLRQKVLLDKQQTGWSANV